MAAMTIPLPNIAMPAKDEDVRVEAIEVDEVDIKTTEVPLLTPPLQENTNAGDISPGPKHQAAFVNKLYSMVEDSAIPEVMWTESGMTFLVTSPIEFSKCLHNYFKHNNWQSFVRQLNMYQFHKVNDVFHSSAVGATTSDSSAWEFKHPYFQRGRVDMLNNIKRKASRPAPQSRDSYTYHSQTREQAYPSPSMRHDQYEAEQQYRREQQQQQQHSQLVQRVDPAVDSINQRIHSIEESQRILMDQTSNVFGALRTYHGILNGIANVLAAAVPDKNTAAIQADLQTLSQQLTQVQYAPRKQAQQQQQHQPQQAHHAYPMRIPIPGPPSPYNYPLTTPGVSTPSWSTPSTPSGERMSPFSPQQRQYTSSDVGDSYFRQRTAQAPSFTSQQQQQPPQQQQQPQQHVARRDGAPMTRPSPPWSNASSSAVLTPPMSDTAASSSASLPLRHRRDSTGVVPRTHSSGSSAHSTASSGMEPAANGVGLPPIRPGLGDRCRSLQSLLNTDGESEDRKRRREV